MINHIASTGGDSHGAMSDVRHPCAPTLVLPGRHVRPLRFAVTALTACSRQLLTTSSIEASRFARIPARHSSTCGL